jgi:thioesterase domain-containing protein/acyl carrier protein
VPGVSPTGAEHRAPSTEHRAPLISELRRLAREKLPEYAVPSAFVILDALPMTPNGKVDRRALPEPAALPPALPAEASAPRDAVELRLAQIWEKLLGVAAVGVTDDFFDLGGHSLMAVRLRAQIEAACGQSLPLAALFQAPTIAQLADVLRREGGPVAAASLVPFRPEGSHPPFFCVYPTIGDVRPFCTLARWIDPEQPFYGLQIPDADGKPPETIEMRDAAARFIAEMRTVQPGGPYLLGGYCFGGLVACEIARQLQAAGQQVSLLLLLDPSDPPGKSSPEQKGALHKALRVLRSRKDPRHVLTRVVGRCRQRAQANIAWFSRNARKLAGLPHRDRFPYALARVTNHLQWRGGLMIYRLYRSCRPLLPRPCRTVMRHLLWRQTEFDVFRDAREEYVLLRYPGRLTLLRAQQHEARHDADRFRSRWQEWSTGSLEMHEIPGDHRSMFDEPHVRVLAETLMACLRRAQSAGRERS